MSKNWKNDGVPDFRFAGKKGYAAAVALVTVLFGGPILDMVSTANNSDIDRAILTDRIERLKEKHDTLQQSVHLLEHGMAGAKMCMPNMKLVYVVEVDEEDQFDEFLFE